jgi:hypothetical protein
VAIRPNAKRPLANLSAELNVAAGAAAGAGALIHEIQTFLFLLSAGCWAAAGVMQRLANDPPREDFAIVETFRRPVWLPAPGVTAVQNRVIRRFVDVAGAGSTTLRTVERIDGIRLSTPIAALDSPDLLTQWTALVLNSRALGRQSGLLARDVEKSNELLAPSSSNGRSDQSETFGYLGNLAELNPDLAEWLFQGRNSLERSLSQPRQEDPNDARIALSISLRELSGSLVAVSAIFRDPLIALEPSTVGRARQ